MQALVEFAHFSAEFRACCRATCDLYATAFDSFRQALAVSSFSSGAAWRLRPPQTAIGARANSHSNGSPTPCLVQP